MFHIHGFASHEALGIALANKKMLSSILTDYERELAAKNDTH